MNTAAAIYARLAGDATLLGYLGTYQPAAPQPGSPPPPAGPAMFTADPPPQDYDLENGHMILIPPDIQIPDDTLSRLGWSSDANIRVYAKRTGSELAIHTTAARIRARLHNAVLTISGATQLICRVASLGPAPAAEPDVTGRMLSIQIKAQEN